jgi:hypothetical protein
MRKVDSVALRKAAAKQSEAPVLDIPIAQVKIVEGTLFEEPQEIEKSAGGSFTVDPNFNCLVEIVEDFGDGSSDGAQFYESFKLKDDGQGGWELRDGTKLAALAKARYGQDFFTSDVEFNELDFIGFVFQAKVQPKKHFTTKQVVGTCLNHESITAIPKPKKKGQKPTAQEEKAELEKEADFNELDF